MKYLNIRQKALFLVAMVMMFVMNVTQAQEIAVLPSDSAVSSGELPNGTRWYVVTNPYVKGVADFALVQMTGSDTIPGDGRESIVALSRDALSGQPLLLSPSVQDYFISKGSVPGPEGFAEVGENATIFRFRNVNMKMSESVLDSTLLVLTGILGKSGGDKSEWFAPADQAIIVAGDVDAAVVSEKLKMLSYMVPFSQSKPRKDYVWVEQDGVRVEQSKPSVNGLTSMILTWRLQRTPKELMNTVMPAIYERYMTMAGMIARERLLARFRAADIPVASVDGTYAGGAGTLGDEEFSVTVRTYPEHALKALGLMSGVMSSIDTHGAEIRELRVAANEFADALYAEDTGADVRNDEYVDRCIYSFVYNTPLSSKKDIRKFHMSRVLEDSTECTVFHSVVSASIDGEKNLTVKTDLQGVTQDSLRAVFAASWKRSEAEKTSARPMPELMTCDTRIKVRSSKKEYLSGGTVMTLSNGMRIIYRNMPTEDNMLHYSLSLGGGAGNVDGLCSEDGGYLSDYFGLCRVGGVPFATFKEVLRGQGMTMQCNVSHSATELSGMLPDDRTDLLFMALLTVMNAREADTDAWGNYCKGEKLRQMAGCASGHDGCLTEDLPSRAEAFFRTLSEKVNDGIFVLVGRIDEKKLKEAVMTYAGGFRTSDRAFARTETYNGNMSGKSGALRKGAAGGVEIHISAPMSLTSENFYASAMASMALRRNLTVATAEMGIRVKVSHECRRHPQEILAVTVSMEEASTEGFAEGTAGYSKEEALDAVREVLSDLKRLKLDEDLLASYRYRLERHLQIEKEKPEYWMDAVRMRYMEGKDFTTGAEAKIAALTADNVRKIFSTLDKGTKVEYVITER